MSVMHPAFDHPGRGRESGVTLVEILVSLSIIGAVASLAMLSLRPVSGSNSAEMEARRLAGLLDLAANEALTTGARIVFEWDRTGYLFRTTGADIPGLSGRQDLGRGVGIHDEEDASQYTIGGAFDAPFTIVIGAGGARWRVVFDGIAARAAQAMT